MMASPPSGSPLPSPDVISRPPSLQPPPVEDHTSPPPFSQVAPSPSPSPPAPPPVVDKTSPPPVPQFASPPSPSLSPFTPVVVFAPVNLVAPILTPSLTSPPPPPPIITPIVSPPHLVEAPPPPKVASTPIISVSSPLPPEPTRPSIASPLFPTVPLSPPTPPPGLPPLSQPRTSLPHLATPTTPSRPPLPPPLVTPLAHSSPPAEVLPAPTELNYTPPPAFPLQPPLPPTSVISPPLPLPLPNVNLPVNSRQSHLSTGLIIVLIIGGVLLLLVLGLVCISYKNKRRRNHAKAEHFHVPPSLKPEGQIKHGLTQGEHVVEVRTGTFSLPLPSTTGRGSRSVISGSENPLPFQSPYVASALSRGTFTYDELVVATDGFSEAKLIGEGGFGYVHKGFLRNGQEVAIKQLREGGRQGEREFQAEVEIISRVHHKHLVSLIGYCISGTKRLLVYEFVPNNTLEFRLHGNEQPVMDWPTRLKIAVGSAKGLAYLHEDCNPVIIHRDIKASNILLDRKFEAKVSDFGFAKSLSNARNSITHSSTRVVGTFGYLAPEYATSGKVTEKSDVYSYGVMLLELITGRPPISDINSVIREALVIWARPLLNQALEDGNFEAIVDPRLKNNYDTDEMTSMIACAAACVRHSSWLRPRMSQIAHALEGNISIVDLNEGMNPGQSNIYGCTSSLNTALANSQCGISKRSGNTSEYGLNLCSSSSNSSNR